MTFAQTGLSPQLLQALEKEGFTIPTPIQEQAIPLILAGVNLVGVAHTGTGKTLAFALPLIERLLHQEGIALIMVPTRELAMQLDKSIRLMSKHIPRMNPLVLISGITLKKQIESLKNRPRIIIATPGRLNEHLDAKTLKLNQVAIVVLDESDRMFDSGFAPQIERILDRTPKTRQTLLFSATMSEAVARQVIRYAPDATRVEITDEEHDMSLVTQEVYLIGSTRRLALLTKILHETKGKVLIFTGTKKTTQALYHSLVEAKFDVTDIHGDRTAAGRAEAIDGFRKNRYRIMVATDVSSRGIDVPTISLVVNYDVPREHETYLHRIGRTGRAGERGRAITFVPPEQRSALKRIEAALDTSFTVLAKQTADPE
jgi:ATP-dependent RNA helicase RhlE